MPHQIHGTLVAVVWFVQTRFARQHLVGERRVSNDDRLHMSDARLSKVLALLTTEAQNHLQRECAQRVHRAGTRHTKCSA